MFLPCRPCCGGGGSDCITTADRMAVTLANLPHENYGHNLNEPFETWGLGYDYLDKYDGTYVLYKTSEDSTSLLDYGRHCTFTYFDAFGTSTLNGQPTFAIVIAYRYDFKGVSGALRWRRSVDVYALGGRIAWYDSGSSTKPSASKTFTNSDVTDNGSTEKYLAAGGVYLPVPWTLTSTTCSIAEYDAASHSSAVKPCYCFDVPVSLTSPDTLYDPTCQSLNGTADPGTSDWYSSVYYPHAWTNPGQPIHCSPAAASYSLAMSSPYSYEWTDYGSDEIDLTISDLVLPSTDTFSVSGTYTLPYVGTYSSWNGGSIPCVGGGYVQPHCGGLLWSAAYEFYKSSVRHILVLGVTLRRTQPIFTYASTPLYPSSRRLYVSVMVYRESAVAGAIPGACQFYQSDGLQSEDTYGSGNMPSVSGGYGVSGTQYFLGCTSTAYQWTWSVAQA